MKARLKRSNDPNGHPELQVTLAGPCDEPALRELARKVTSALEAGPVRGVVIDISDLEFDVHDQGQLYRAVTAVLIARAAADRFRIVDALDRQRRLVEFVMRAK